MAVYVFLHDDYSDWELGYLLPELRTPPTSPQIEKRPRQVVTFGLNDAAVTSSGGLRVTPDAALASIELDDVDALVLPGGTFWKSFESDALATLVRKVRATDRLTGAICAATGFVARLGLLDDVPHTSNSCGFLKQRAPDYAGQPAYKKRLAVREDNLVTASGLGAIDFTYELLRALDVYPQRVLDVWLRAFKHGEDPFADDQ
jgi:putative intracellular protease/amidase